MTAKVFSRFIILMLTSLLMSSSTLIHDFPGACNYKLKQTNNSDERRIIMERGVFVEYTPQELINRGNYSQILQMDLALEKDGKDYLITLFSTFFSKKTQRTYGLIKNATKMKVDLVNGEKIYLQHLGNGDLKMNAEGGIEFVSGFSLNKKDVQLLLKSEVETIGVLWSSGYEMYEVYNMDIIRDQLTCIQKL